MAHLLSFIDTRPQFETSQPPEPHLPPTKNINASPKTALLVENDESLLNFLKSFLKNDGYTVRTTSAAFSARRFPSADRVLVGLWA